MKVLVLVDHAVGISGPHRNVVGSLNALGARDDVTVRLLTGEIDPGEPYAKAKNVEVCLGYRPHSIGGFFANVRLVRRAARGCDAVYVPSGLKSFLYAQLVRRGRRLVAGPNVTHLPIRRADSPGWLEIAMMCDAWIEASNARREHVLRHVGRRLHDKVFCIHHAIDTAKFSPERRSPEVWERYGIRPDPVKVLHVGRDDEPRKGVSQLLDAIESLNRKGAAASVDFILVGRMSESTATRASPHGNVHLLGFRRGEELAAIYASSDIGVIPSSWENMPFTVLEAMASGLAVVASRAEGIIEQIEDGRSGLLVDIVGPDGKHRPEAGEILATAIAGLIEDAALRGRLAAGARARVLDHFCERRLGEELVSVLRSDRGSGAF